MATGANSINLSTSSSRRSFNLFGSRRFSFSVDNIIDSSISIFTMCVERVILLLGPVLICFASAIISGLSWTFFSIYLPMMQRSLVDASPVRRWIEIGINITFVVFILIEIIFNYYMCVTTRNTGPSFNKVVLELAESTNFDYPSTPQDVARFRRDFNDKMMQRMRRRQAREAEQRQQQQQLLQQQRSTSKCCENKNCIEFNQTSASVTRSNKNRENTNTIAIVASSSSSVINPTTVNISDNGSEKVTLRKTTRQQQQSSCNNGNSSNANVAPATQIRSWMIMTPDEWGFCQRTNQPKPPRSHFDHVSKTLVLCMDHYCPWMFNVIGYFNYRYFVNFLIFVFSGMMYGAFIAYRPFVNSTSKMYRQQYAQYRKTGVWSHIHPYTPINTERMPLSLSFMLCLAVGIAVACLGGFHIYLVLTGQTTIEFHANYVNKTKAKRSGQKYRNPYDRGWKRNWQQVYGYRSSILMSILMPSTREPDFLPLPISGEEGKRAHLRRKDDDKNKEVYDCEGNIQIQQTRPFLEPSGSVNIV